MTEIHQLHQRFCKYSHAFKGNTPRTLQWFAEVFGYFQKFTGIAHPWEITEERIEEWIIDGKLERDWKDKTIRNRIQALKSFTDWLLERKYIEDDPLENIQMPKLGSRIPEHLSKEKAEELLLCAKYYSYEYDFERTRALAIVATFLFTGIRRQELINLKTNDVDLQNRTVFVKCGKGKKDRYVPFCPRLSSILYTYLRDRERLRKTCSFFFTSLKYNSKMGDKVIPRLFKKLREKCKFHFYPHMLRHTFAVLMLQGGCDLYHLADMMGHSDIKTTTIYLKATVDHLKKQVGKHPLSGTALPQYLE